MNARRAELVAHYGFPLDDFQLRALDALDAGQSVLVAAPTGSGKTVVAEYAIDVAIGDGHRAFYTAPIKALSNQKYHDLVARLGPQNVGLLTGDNTINGDAPVVVMTTEVLRNMIYARSASLDRLSVVVLDEVHFLQDTYRGPVWEEVIIHLPTRVHLVCLSATRNPGSTCRCSRKLRTRSAAPTVSVMESASCTTTSVRPAERREAAEPRLARVDMSIDRLTLNRLAPSAAVATSTRTVRCVSQRPRGWTCSGGLKAGSQRTPAIATLGPGSTRTPKWVWGAHAPRVQFSAPSRKTSAALEFYQRF